jgi:hypothetical protein
LIGDPWEISCFWATFSSTPQPVLRLNLHLRRRTSLKSSRNAGDRAAPSADWHGLRQIGVFAIAIGSRLG